MFSPPIHTYFANKQNKISPGDFPSSISDILKVEKKMPTAPKHTVFEKEFSIAVHLGREKTKLLGIFLDSGQS